MGTVPTNNDHLWGEMWLSMRTVEDISLAVWVTLHSWREMCGREERRKEEEREGDGRGEMGRRKKDRQEIGR